MNSKLESSTTKTCPIAIVGTGFVSDMYVSTLGNHPHLQLAGLYDSNADRAKLHSERWDVTRYSSLEELLQNSGVEIVLNLTNPRSHFAVTKQCLEGGKHVYSEKPLGMTVSEGTELVELAKSRGLLLASAPCSWLSESAFTIRKAIQDGLIGKVRLVYANFDDGLIAPKMDPWNWHNAAGIPWPAKDEFEVGCTFEHAGYMLTWLAYFFGSAKSITSFASCQIPDKGIAVDHMAPDFSAGCITYDDGIVARVTCGLVAPRDKSLTIIGDDGIIYTDTIRSDIGPIYIQQIPTQGRWGGIERRINRVRSFLERTLPSILWSGRDWQFRKKLPLIGTPPKHLVGRGKPVDFLRGPAEMAASLQENRECRITAEFGLHIMELTHHLQHPQIQSIPLKTEFRNCPTH
jgi:predicted dehydrogenase